MSDCIIKSGESVDPNDSRLSDTACVIETGVIIRPPPDLSLAVDTKPAAKPAAVVIHPQMMVVAPPVLPGPKLEKIAKEPEVVKTQETIVTKTSAPAAHTAVPSVGVPVTTVEVPGIINPTTAAIAAGAVIAVAGTAASTAMGGLSAVQAKIASVLGVSKGAIATGAVVTAGTIVAVKALENKMSTLEKDLEKTKKEVGSAASSIDRIDALLDKLGS